MSFEIFMEKAFWGLVFIFGSLVVVIYKMVLTNIKKDLEILKSEMKSSTQDELSRIKSEIREEMGKDHAHLLENIDRVSDLVIAVFNNKSDEFDRKAADCLRRIK